MSNRTQQLSAPGVASLGAWGSPGIEMHDSGCLADLDASARRQFALSCVVPVFNEERVVACFLERLHEVTQPLAHGIEFVVVNDGSEDASRAEILRVAQRLPIRYLELSRNFGKESAIQAGLDAARGDCVLIIDADFQHPLELVPRMIERWRAGADVVYGVRKDREEDSRCRGLATRLFYRLVRQRNRFEIPANAGDFRVLDLKVVQAIRQMPERNRYMKGLYAWVGFRAEALEYVAKARAAGASRFSRGDLFELAMTGVTAFSTRPLRMLAVAGFTISALSMLFAVWVVVERLLLGQPIAGFTTLASAISFLGGAQLVALGVLGEYIGRIFEEVKRRPLYLTALDVDHSPLHERIPATAQARSGRVG